MDDRFDEILGEMRSERADWRAEMGAERAGWRAQMGAERADWRAQMGAERADWRAQMGAERAQWHAQMSRRLDQTDENLRFLGELNRRSEIVFQHVVRELREMREETRASTETTKAHTRAIFAVIDRLEGGGGGVASAT